MLVISVSRSVLLLERVEGLVLEGVSSSKAQGLLKLAVVGFRWERDVGRVLRLGEGSRGAGSRVGSVSSNETFPSLSDDVSVASSAKRRGRRGGQSWGGGRKVQEGRSRRSASNLENKRIPTVWCNVEGVDEMKENVLGVSEVR